jgi:hypothetical protein
MAPSLNDVIFVKNPPNAKDEAENEDLINRRRSTLVAKNKFQSVITDNTYSGRGSMPSNRLSMKYGSEYRPEESFMK